MKKVLCLILLSIFLISMMPLASAGKQNNAGVDLVQNDEGDLIAKRQPMVKRQPVVDKQQVREKILERVRDVQLKRVQSFVKLRKEEAFQKFKEEGLKARKISGVQFREAKRRYKNAKQNLISLKKQYITKKKGIIDLRRELKKLEGEEYIEKEKELKLAIKDFLVDISDTVLKHLEMVKENIETNEDLSEEEASEVLQEISEEIEQVEEAKENIEALTDESTKEEIAEAAEGLKESWNKVKGKAKKRVGKLMNARIGGIVVRSKQLEAKLAKVMERMTEKGKDTSVVEPLVDEFGKKLDEAKDYYTEAREQFKNDLVQEGQKHMKSAHNSLKEANEVLRNIFKELKSQGMEKAVEEEPEIEETEELEEEE